MPKKTARVHPPVRRALERLGENVRLARKRRELTQALVAERAGMSIPTLRSIERGSPTVTLGALANVLHALGLEDDLGQVAHDDELGRRLQDAKLLGKTTRDEGR
jgi:transcriptional regulator with XRE-family HTH domain